jgi:hypothetical protein
MFPCSVRILVLIQGSRRGCQELLGKLLKFFRLMPQNLRWRRCLDGVLIWDTDAGQRRICTDDSNLGLPALMIVTSIFLTAAVALLW